MNKDEDFEAWFAEQKLIRRAAERPLVEELHALGLPVDSVWYLRTSGLDYTHALPMLLEHLERGGYPDTVAQGIAASLNVKASSPYWSRIKELYLHANGPAEQGSLANVLDTLANRKRIPEIIELLDVPPHFPVDPGSDPRIAFVKTILRHGGEEGLQLVESLKNDPILGTEATALLKQREARRRRREAHRTA